MTTAAAPPLQLALALDVVFDAPTARERADLMRDLRGVCVGDAWVSGEYRIERDDVTGCDTIRFLRGAHVRGEWAVTSANRLAAALRMIHAELVGTGITTGWLMCGALYADDEADCAESLCETVTENIGYNYTDDGVFRQEALLAALPAITHPDTPRLPSEINRWEMGYDTGIVTVKGQITVDMGIFGAQKVSGSRSCVRDPRLHFLSDLKPIPRYLKGGSRPEIISAIPRDKDGTLMRFCSGGHYAPRSEFGKNARNQFVGKRDGLDDYCLRCRKAQRTLHRMTSSRAA